jgi:hypothetical protein
MLGYPGYVDAKLTYPTAENDNTYEPINGQGREEKKFDHFRAFRFLFVAVALLEEAFSTFERSAKKRPSNSSRVNFLDSS